MNNVWVTHYEIAAIILLLALLILFFAGHKLKTRESSLFLGMVVSALTMAIFDEAATYALMYSTSVPVSVHYFLNVVYNFGVMCVMMHYALYVIYTTNYDKKLGKLKLLLLLSPIMLEMLAIISSPLTHFIFYINSEGQYCRGVGMIQFQVFSGIYMIYLSILSIKRSRFLSMIQLATVLFYAVSAIVCVVLQLIFTRYLLNAFAIAVGLVLAYVSLQGNFVDTDRVLDTFSAEALRKKIDNLIDSKTNFYLVMLRLGGFDQINASHGYETSNEILCQVSEYLMKTIPGHRVFHLTGLYFACLFENPADDEVTLYAHRMEQRLLSGFYVKDIKNMLMVSFGLVIINGTKYIHSAEDPIALMDMVLDEPMPYDLTHIKIVDDEIEEHYVRTRQVEKALERAIRNGSFTINYQPIIDMRTGKVHAAEALVRLHDDQYGEIRPDEFIPIAEKNGSIDQITNFVVASVCRYIRANDLKECGVDYIEINLSAVECMHPGMAERILGILKNYNVDYNLINFEITETAAVAANSNVTKNLEMMTSRGISFALDDYGTGYSNICEFMTLPLSVVKIDKSLLWLAMKDDNAMRILKNLTKMILEMERKILVEGAETKEHIELLEKLGVDYVQGYFYSKPVDEERFTEFVQDKNVYGI